MAQADPEKFLQTRLLGVRCINQTDDYSGSDEFVLAYSQQPGGPPPATDDQAVAQIHDGRGLYKRSMDEGHLYKLDRVLGSTPVSMNEKALGMLVELGDDDDSNLETWSDAAVLGGVPGALGGLAAEGAAGSAIGFAVGTAAHFVHAAYLDSPGLSELIGRVGYQASAVNIAQRGILSHDGVLDPIATLDQVTGYKKHLFEYDAAVHPGFDLRAYQSRSSLLDNSCTNDSQCGAAINQCYVGACVKDDFLDRTLPKIPSRCFDDPQSCSLPDICNDSSTGSRRVECHRYDLAGLIQLMKFQSGGETHPAVDIAYDILMTTSISGFDIRRSE